MITPLCWVFVSVLWIPKIILFGTDLFKSTKTEAESLTIYVTIFAGLYFGAFIWSLVLQCKCLGEVQGFSAWKAILNYLLAGLLLLPIYIMIALCWIVWYGMAHI